MAEKLLRWLGQAIRLPGSSAAKKALEEAERYVRPQGRSHSTWLSSMKKQLSDINITWNEAQILANDRYK